MSAWALVIVGSIAGVVTSLHCSGVMYVEVSKMDWMTGGCCDTVLVLGSQKDITNALRVVRTNPSVPGQGEFDETKWDSGHASKSSLFMNGAVKT